MLHLDISYIKSIYINQKKYINISALVMSLASLLMMSACGAQEPEDNR